MVSAPREAELKFELEAEDLARLRVHPVLKALTSDKAVTRNLRSIYYDTPGDALFQKNISLRVRKVGARWVQTVKRGTGVRGGLSNPIELEVDVNGEQPDIEAVPDKKLKAEILELIAETPVVARFETLIRRTTRILETDTGDRVELALDTGEVVAGDQSVVLCEAELELIEGSVQALYSLARVLFDVAPLRFSGESKAARGFRLAHAAPGERTAPIAPRIAAGARMKASLTAEEGFQEILRGCLDQISNNRIAMLQSEDPEGPHQLRVGLRRLRSAFKTFRPLANDAETQRLSAEARRIAAIAGDLRDLDVLISDIVAPAQETCPQPDVMNALRQVLEEHRQDMRSKACAALRDPKINAFVLDLGAYTEMRGWLRPDDIGQRAMLTQPIAAFADQALDACWDRVTRAAENLEQLSIEERYDVRKALKKLRYAVEFFAALYKPKNLKPFLKQLKKLQDLFGYLNDVAMAATLTDLDLGTGRNRDAVERAIGYTIGWHQAHSEHAWSDTQARWHKLSETKRFWT